MALFYAKLNYVKDAKNPPLLLSLYLSIFPLEVGPLNPARGSGELCKLLRLGLESNLVHFSFKIRHLVPTILMIFLILPPPAVE